MSDRLKILFQHILPKQRLTGFAGRVARAKGGAMTTRLIRWFVGKYGVDMSEAENPDIASYASFNDFFTRPLRAGARSLAEADFVCPVDGAISQFGRIEHDQILQAMPQPEANPDAIEELYAAAEESGVEVLERPVGAFDQYIRLKRRDQVVHVRAVVGGVVFVHGRQRWLRPEDEPAQETALREQWIAELDAVGDFAAWMEVYLGDRWYAFDPRNNAPRIGRILIAQGRDLFTAKTCVTCHVVRGNNMGGLCQCAASVRNSSSMPITLGAGVPARASCARMYCLSSSLTLSQSRCSSSATSLMVLLPQRRPTR